jgi:D-alanine transfer protein
VQQAFSAIAGAETPLKDNTYKPSNIAAASVALGIVAFLLLVAAVAGGFLERRYVHALAPQLFPEKGQGLVLQKIAFGESDLLPFYGSSELVKPAANKAADFFRTYPTGFSVFSVGKAGAESLILLQKLGALGSDLRGKKVVISISPTWFFKENSPAAYYDGNFSLLQAGELIYSSQLSFDLKRDVARRMLDYPKTLEKSALLAFTLRNLAADSPVNRLLYYATVPLGLFENSVLRMQDHFEMLFYIWKDWWRLHPHVRRSQRTIEWDSLIAEADAKVREHNDSDLEPIGPENGSGLFLAGEQNAHEWIDFELLLRGLNEIGARPLLLSIPIDGQYFDSFGVGRPFRDLYYKRIRSLARSHDVPLVDFEGHDLDQDFLAGHHDHLTDKGWLYFDKVIDDFYHDRLVLQPHPIINDEGDFNLKTEGK